MIWVALRRNRCDRTPTPSPVLVGSVRQTDGHAYNTPRRSSEYTRRSTSPSLLRKKIYGFLSRDFTNDSNLCSRRLYATGCFERAPPPIHHLRAWLVYLYFYRLPSTLERLVAGIVRLFGAVVQNFRSPGPTLKKVSLKYIVQICYILFINVVTISYTHRFCMYSSILFSGFEEWIHVGDALWKRWLRTGWSWKRNYYRFDALLSPWERDPVAPLRTTTGTQGNLSLPLYTLNLTRMSPGISQTARCDCGVDGTTHPLTV